MLYDTHTFPLKTHNKTTTKDPNCDNSTDCNACSTEGGCCGLGIKAGSDKNIVYRNIFILTVTGIVFIVITFGLMQLLKTLLG
ncbi:hypothetical protein [Methanohalobium sp.]|uniref:hypothetical protein n=1 Tax=Methanohalobium sp. TaxID=2837493 RepID=UPI0025E826EE|nr:hypothetical protein [Methanohalobium sp.]